MSQQTRDWAIALLRKCAAEELGLDTSRFMPDDYEIAAILEAAQAPEPQENINRPTWTCEWCGNVEYSADASVAHYAVCLERAPPAPGPDDAEAAMAMAYFTETKPTTLAGALERISNMLALLRSQADRIAALSALATRSTRRLVELSEPGSIGAFAARDAAIERAEKAEAALSAQQGQDRRDAERYRQARQCARLGQHGEWVLLPDDPHHVRTMHADFDADVDRAIAAAKPAEG